MNKVRGTALIIILLFGFSVKAEASFTNTNYWDIDHSQPAWFTADDNGGFFGETQSGEHFTQKPIITKDSLKIHKFVIANSFFFISDQGIILADSDLQAVSIYLAMQA